MLPDEAPQVAHSRVSELLLRMILLPVLQAPNTVVQTLNSAIHWINNFAADKY